MLTIEALKANLSDVHLVALTDYHFEKALIDVGLSKDAEYAATDSTLIDGATLLIYDIILAGADFSEGGMSYSLRQNTQALRDSLKAKLEGTNERRNTVTNLAVW